MAEFNDLSIAASDDLYAS